MTRLDGNFPVIGETPKCSDTLVCKWRMVCKFKCRCCSTSYLGQTTRHLQRVSEHLGISPRTGKPSSSPVVSSIFSHLNSTGHSANFDNFEILFCCSDTWIRSDFIVFCSYRIGSDQPLFPLRMNRIKY